MKCDDIIDEIILHEIIGVTSGGGGGTDLTITDEGIFVASGVDTIDFVGSGITAVNVGGGNVRVTVPDIQVDGDILWVYDVTRDKWLSSFRATFGAGERGRIKNKYIPVFDGQVSNLSGYRVVRTATITAIAAQTRNTETWTLRVRKNGGSTNIASLVMTSVNGNHSSSIDVDLDEGDQIQFFADTTGFLGIKDPLVWVEVAWRNDSLAAP